MIASTREDGCIGVVVPHGVLFREGDEGKIRQGLLVGKDGVKGDLIEAIIGLPTSLFFNTGIAAAILVINKAKPAVLKDKVIFIDASADFENGKNMNQLRDEDITRITSAFKQAKKTLIDAGEQTTSSLKELLKSIEVEKYLRVVEMSEIIANDFNLNISRYIDTSIQEISVNIHNVLERSRHIEEKLAITDAKLSQMLKILGID